MGKIIFSYLGIKPLRISEDLGLIHATLRGLRYSRDLDFGHPALSLRLPMGQLFLPQPLGQRARFAEERKAQRRGIV